MARESLFGGTRNDKPEGETSGTGSDIGGKPDAASGEQSARPSRFNFVDPGSFGSEGSNSGSDASVAGEPERKRRKYTKRAGTTKGAESIPVEGFAQILLQGHAMLAALTKTQELYLSQDEALMLAQASANVARHYDVQMAAKTVDWVNLAMALGNVYGTRLAAIKMRSSVERKERAATAKPAPANPADTTFAGIVPAEPDFMNGYMPGGMMQQ